MRGLFLFLLMGDCLAWAASPGTDELKSYRRRIEYTSQGSCNCYYLTLSATKGWGQSRDPEPVVAAGLSVDWLDAQKKEIVISPNMPIQGSRRYWVLSLAPDSRPRPLSSYIRPERSYATRGGGPLGSIYRNPTIHAGAETGYLVDPATGITALHEGGDFPGKPTNWVWGAHYIRRDRHPIIDPAGSDLSYNGTHYIEVFDRVSKAPVLSLQGRTTRFLSNGFAVTAQWFDDRFLIFPATTGSEIVYVCDLESKRPR